MIATGFELPFRFEHSDPGLLTRKPVTVWVRTSTIDTARLVPEALGRFGRAACAGAFGNCHLGRLDTAFGAVAGHAADPRDFLAHVVQGHLPAESWIVLCHLLMAVHKSVPIERVEVAVAGDRPLRSLTHTSESTYPPAYASLPFALDDTEPEGGGYTFNIGLESPLTPGNEATLNERLGAWVEAVAHGGYALAPVDPSTDYVEPYGDGVTAYDRIVEWAVFKLRADPVAAINALLNVLACFHLQCQRICSVEIA